MVKIYLAEQRQGLARHAKGAIYGSRGAAVCMVELPQVQRLKKARPLSQNRIGEGQKKAKAHERLIKVNLENGFLFNLYAIKKGAAKASTGTVTKMPLGASR